MMDILYWLFFLVLIGALIMVCGLLLRGYLTTGNPADGLNVSAFFGPRPERRLEVVDQANVDGRRRLVLIRRDDVEHLIMTGGPVDVVIETGIGPPKSKTAAETIDGSATNIFQRTPRTLGQVIAEK